MIKQLVIAGCLATLPAAAFAQAKEDKVEFKRRTVIDFSTLDITGRIVRPEATLIRGRGRTKFRPLIRSRGDFRPEMLKSIEQL